jgi:very-short-patch-repair endonuclease
MQISIAAVLKMYDDDDMSTYAIAKHFGTYPNKINRMLTKEGRKLKSKSDAQKAALSSGRKEHPTAGKERTPEERLAISKSMSGFWDKMSDEVRQSRSEISKRLWESKSASERQAMSQAATEGLRRSSVEGSKVENYFVDGVSLGGFRIEQHKKNLLVNEKLEIDLYVHECRTIIEVDGPSHFLPIWGEDKLKKQQKADEDKNGLVLRYGFIMVRVLCPTGNPSLFKRQGALGKLLELLEKVRSDQGESQPYVEIEV